MPATLLDLPNEVLYLVASNFELLKPRKPKPQPQPPGQHSQTLEFRPSDRQSLVSLIATCRHLRDSLQPLLYHTVYPYMAEIEFAWTLQDRPDFAARVHDLYYASNAHEDRENRPLYTKPVNKHALRSSPSSGKSNFNKLAAEHPRGLDIEDIYEGEKGQILGQDYLGLWRYLNANGSDVHEIKQRLLDRALLIQTLELIPGLRKLSLWYEPYDIKSLPSGILPRLQHCQIFGRDPWWSTLHAPFEGFSEAMPTLAVLDCFFIKGLITEDSSTITELNLTHCFLERKDFDKIAAGFTSLRKLSYCVDPPENGGEGEPWTSAQEVCEALYPRRDTLRELSISYDHFESLSTHNPTACCFLPKLTGLERLSLNVNTLSDLRKSLPLAAPIGKLFPSSLRRVDMCLGRTSAHWLQPYLDWLSTRTDFCPNLQYVKICHHAFPPDPEIANLFRARGANYTFSRNFDHDDYKLKEAHCIDPINQLQSYDEYHGWQFWDPEVDRMTILYHYR